MSKGLDLLVAASRNITQRRQAEEEANEAARFETQLSEVSARFVNLPAEQVDGAVEDAMRVVCERLELDLSTLWQCEAETSAVYRMTHFYRRQQGPPPSESVESQDYYPWFERQLVAGNVVVVPSVDKMPPDAARGQEVSREYGVKSVVALPLSTGGAPVFGFVSFETTVAERAWSQAVVRQLQLVAQVFASALARKHSDEALRTSEERLSLAADAAEAGMWVLDYRTAVFWATNRARAIFGYAPDEVITRERFETSIHPDDLADVREAIERSSSAAQGPFRVEYRVLPDNGDVRWVSSRGRAQLSSSGEPERLMGVTIDITERKAAQEVLRASEARLRAGADLADLAYYEVDFDSNAAYVDSRYRDICGVPPGVGEGLEIPDFWMNHLHPDDRSRILAAREELHGGRLERVSVEYRYLHPAKGERWIHHLACVASRDATGRTVLSYGVLRDVTERKRVEEDLHHLSRRLIGAHEEQRALVARELHDDVSQRLAALAIDAGRAELSAPDGPFTEAMRALHEGLVGLSEDVHSLAYQLHPSVLEELGLAEALHAECERRGRQGHLDFSLDLDSLPAVIEKDVALCLFRIAQEALGNVLRHADATVAGVELRQAEESLVLVVSDDGAGFDPVSPGEGRHLGLASMRERVHLVNGTLDIESTPGHGTRIVAWVPVGGGSR